MRIKILIQETPKNDFPREINFDANMKTEKDLPEVLREIANLLESPVIEDKELF